MDNQQLISIQTVLERVAKALESAAGMAKAIPPKDWGVSKLWVWQEKTKSLKPASGADALPLPLMIGIDDQIKLLWENTKQFADGFTANNALLWGARGMGKSSIVKSIHAEISKNVNFHLVEIHREDIHSLPQLIDILRAAQDHQSLLFCDDLSFDDGDGSYKSLKAVLEGGIETRPPNVLLYATSNRRHLLPRKMIENEREVAIHPSESVEEKVSLSDRFGLWLGFYPCSQEDYLLMVAQYAKHYGLTHKDSDAIEWFRTRGHMSGRVAWQFIQDLAGKQGVKI